MEFSEVLKAILAGAIPERGRYLEVPPKLFFFSENTEIEDLPPIEAFVLRDGQAQSLGKLNTQKEKASLEKERSLLFLQSDAHWIKRQAEKIVMNSSKEIEERLGISKEDRYNALQTSARNTVTELFTHPTKENIDKSIKVVGSFVHVLMKEPESFPFLQKLSHHDPYTVRHSVGTAINCIMLAQKIGIKDPKLLNDIGTAGLLHDIGKVKIDPGIINKPGKLDPQEWEVMQTHSAEGFELVRNNDSIDERAKRAILEHHEEKEGTGYPLKLHFDEVDQFSKIVAISDIFNAITTNRPYSKALTPFEAFQLIKEKMPHKIDEELLRHLILLYGGSLPD